MAPLGDVITATLEEAASVWLGIPSGLDPIVYEAVNERFGRQIMVGSACMQLCE